MSFEYIVKKPDKVVKLSEEEQNKLAHQIRLDFKTYNEGRAVNLENARKLIDEVFFKTSFAKETDKTKKWKAKVKMCKTFMYFQTLKAFVWKNTYSNINSMFDVSGENQEADSASNKQKAMLVDIFEKMEYQKVIDLIIDNSLFYGELISYTAWKKNEEEIRRPINYFKDLFQNDLEKLPAVLDAIAKGKKYWIDKRETFNNPYIYAVNPADLAFDNTQIDDWDSCPKIYKTWKTPDDIINNKLYTITKAQAEDIKNMVKKTPDSSDQSNQTDDKLIDEEINGNTVEVLEHWGDLKLPNGTILKNWHAVSIAGKYLVRFHKNDMTINPFTYGTLLTDPDTKRGISPLVSVLKLAETQEELMNKTYNMQALSENPPTFAPEDFFKDKTTKLYPGKIITYDAGIYTNVPITPMQFPTNLYINEIMSLDKTIAEVSGIFPNMAGQEKAQGATATEISVTVQGQSNRHSMLLDIINQYLILPIVKKTADLLANFKYGKETIYINRENKADVIDIDDTVRQGNYEYTYQDRNSYALRYTNADTTAQVFEKFAQVLPMNWKEIFSWYWEQKGVENPERFLEEEKSDEDKLALIQSALTQNSELLTNVLVNNQNDITDEEVPLENIEK